MSQRSTDRTLDQAAVNNHGAFIWRIAESVPSRVILIDGARLTSLMIRYGVGVQVKQTHHIVEIDEDFFA